MTKRTEHWNHYWQSSKSLNSFSEGDAALGYRGSSQLYWYDTFNKTAKNAVIVDIASGNGALAISAVTFSELNDKNFTVYACDIADIKPEVLFQSEPDILAKLKKVQFYPATAIEHLPFEDNSVDLIISQFGFEYADQSDAVTECQRVLKPNGRFNALVHHADSFISKDSVAGLAFYKYCLSDSGFLTQVEQLLVLAESCWLKGISPTTDAAYAAQNKELFKFAYGSEEITETKIQFALAQFIRSIQSFDSKYDVGRALAANDGQPFSNFTAQENQGKNLFLSPPVFDANGVRTSGGLGCAGCHRAPEFDIDPNSLNNGIIGTIAGTGIDTGNTRAPSLRDLVRTDGTTNGPMMHTGVITTLQAAIGHYGTINIAPGNNNLDPRLTPRGVGQQLNLNATEVNAVIAFLRTLSGTDVYTNTKWSNPFN